MIHFRLSILFLSILLLSLFTPLVSAQDSLNISAVGSLYDFWLEPEDICIVGDYAFVVAQDGLHVMDISDPETPSELGGLDFYGYESKVVEKHGYLYVIEFYRVLIIDIHTPVHPVLISTIQSEDHHTVTDISISGNALYMAVPYSGFWLEEK
ncbi:hypothetical protein K8I28_14285 [bacterium]|nr:hypothetical protein [bacterium]